MSSIDTSKLKAFSHIHTVNQLLRELVKLPQIDYFFYSKIFDDNTRITLSSEAEWLKVFTTTYHQIGVASNTFQSYRPGYLLWPVNGKEEIYKTMVNQYGISNQITLVIKESDCVELFTYATHSNRKPMHNVYLNNLDKIQNTSLYIKEKLSNIILGANQDRYNNHPITESINENITLPVALHPAFSTYNITPREMEVLNYIALGYTAKRIGKSLQISFRTVESHIAILKKKLMCSYKNDLAEKAIKAGLIRIYDDK